MRGLWRIQRLLRRERVPPPPVRAPGSPRGRRTLLAGWFTFGRWGATAGDLLVRDLAEGWLREAGHDVDVANLPPFEGGVDWRRVDPGEYDHVVFVCGPFPRERHTQQFLERFAGARVVGLNLTMIEPLERWNPFDLLWERDSDAVVRPDVTFLADRRRVPVIGLCLVEHQQEHAGGRHDVANAALRRLVESREMAVVPIDTRLDQPDRLLRTPGEVESMIARVDALLTTRLHGTVLAIKAGVPPLVVDPIAGGAKVLRQAERLGWPQRYTADALRDEELQAGLEWCLGDAARRMTEVCRESAVDALRGLEEDFVRELAASRAGLDGRGANRADAGQTS